MLGGAWLFTIVFDKPSFFRTMLVAFVPAIFDLNNVTFAQDNKDLYAEEAAAQRERERQRMLTIPGLIAPNEIQDEMVDS